MKTTNGNGVRMLSGSQKTVRHSSNSCLAGSGVGALAMPAAATPTFLLCVSLVSWFLTTMGSAYLGASEGIVRACVCGCVGEVVCGQ